jgi:hypothetical protein
MLTEREPEQMVKRCRNRSLLLSVCLAAVSCAQEPPPEAPPAAPTQEAVRLNAASMALKKEERKLYLLKRDEQAKELAAVHHVFSTMLPPGLTIKGLRTAFLDPRRGGESINFEESDDRTDAEQANLQKVREFADKFAAECKQPDSPTAKKVAAAIDALPITKELREQQELVDKLRHEHGDAQAAMPADKPQDAE